MQLRRWLTALLLAPLLVALVALAPRWAFVALVSSAVAVCLHEYYRMASPQAGPRRYVWILWGGLLPVAFALGGPSAALAAATLGAVCFFGAFVLKGEVRPTILDILGREFLGLAYIALLLSYFVLLRDLEAGRFWVLFVLAVAFAEDTGAYYFGRALGRRKLCPTLSPGKTVSGAVGGLVAAAFAAFACRALFMPPLAVGDTIALGLLIGVAGQTGDLFESLIKRASGVKDSGTLLPGHGGLLDRIDSLVFSAPAVYYYYAWLLGGG